MRKELNKIKMDGTIVIGEKWMKHQCYLLAKKLVQSGQIVAVDPLEGTNLVTKDLRILILCWL